MKNNVNNTKITWFNVNAISNIIITTINTSFGTVIPYSTYDIIDSLNIRNNGSGAPSSDIYAKFITNIGRDYGLMSGSEIINASYFELNNTAFNTDGSNVTILLNDTLVAGFNGNISARLNVPAWQTQGDYNGTIRLSWIV